MAIVWDDAPAARKIVFEGEEEDEQDEPFSGLSAATKFFSGVQDIPQFLMKTLLGADGKDTSEIDKLTAERTALNERMGGAGDWWRTAGQIAAGGPTGGPVARGGPLLKGAAERVGNVAAESGLFGAMTENPNIGQDIGFGAGIGAAVEGVRGIPGLVGSGVKAIASRLQPDEAARAADTFAESRKVPVMGDDLIRNPLVRGSGRIVDAADPMASRQKQLDKFAEAFKREVVDPFTEFDDPVAEMGEGFKRQYDGVNKVKKRLYRQAFDALNPLGAVPMDDFRNEMLQLNAQLTNKYGEGSKEAQLVSKWFDYGDANIEDWVDRRKKLGRDIRKAARSADPDTVDIGAMRQVQDSLDRAIDQFGGQNGAYRQANEFFKQRVLPYREEAFGKLVKKGDIEKATLSALGEGPTAQTQAHFRQVWSKLDENGRKAYRQAMLDKVMEAATNPETGFSPDRAATMLDKLENRLGPEVVGKDLVEAMKGWNNLFRQSGFAAENVARSRTGASVAQLGPLAAVATGVAIPPALLTMAPALIVRSRKVRQMLAKLAKMDPRHPDYTTVSSDIIAELTREAGRSQALATGEN